MTVRLACVVSTGIANEIPAVLAVAADVAWRASRPVQYVCNLLGARAWRTGVGRTSLQTRGKVRTRVAAPQPSERAILQAASTCPRMPVQQLVFPVECTGLRPGFDDDAPRGERACNPGTLFDLLCPLLVAKRLRGVDVQRAAARRPSRSRSAPRAEDARADDSRIRHQAVPPLPVRAITHSAGGTEPKGYCPV